MVWVTFPETSELIPCRLQPRKRQRNFEVADTVSEIKNGLWQCWRFGTGTPRIRSAQPRRGIVQLLIPTVGRYVYCYQSSEGNTIDP